MNCCLLLKKGKYSQKILDHAKQSATDAVKTASKRTEETNGDLIGNKTVDKVKGITSRSALETVSQLFPEIDVSKTEDMLDLTKLLLLKKQYK